MTRRTQSMIGAGAALLAALALPLGARTLPGSSPRGQAASLPGIPLDPKQPVQVASAQPQSPQPAQGAQRGGGFIGNPLAPPPIHVPDGFTSIFNGKDLSGWHISKTNHHGTTPDYHVMHGLIVGTQNPLGGGGILLTDKSYKNLEVYLEVKPDWGCDSGLFLRSTEAGEAYQVTLDYLPGGTIGGIYGEELQGVGGRGGAASNAQPAAVPAPPTEVPWMKAWKREDWNTVRARITGDVPHITVWINDQQVTDFTDTANHAANGITQGPIAIQVHGATRWVPGGLWRWRAIAVKELPN
jgi:Domain of Unknown Function (DUF1080)